MPLNRPFVEYKGTVPQNEMQGKQKDIELEANALISEGGKVSVAILPYEEASEQCGGSLPDYIPKGSTPRIVKLGNSPGGPCGGTHVSDISEIGILKVSQIRSKKGMTKAGQIIQVIAEASVKMVDVELRGSAHRIKKCACDLLSIGGNLVDDDGIGILMENDLRLKSTFLYCDSNRMISSAPRDQKKPFTELANKLFCSIETLINLYIFCFGCIHTNILRRL
ncbi:hypothetical protein SO802_022477 [Lithocarpus litseifolius]|uniref:Threonyl/alanyl tRNA synthetase SAD domain-containing protein n=1 Tax=Lithocarpus litseifolius TaxID=425828 RepID=A0AAW2C6K9_9ROSI